MKRVTGIGGIFFKSADVKKLKEWYGKHLGFDVTEWGCSFKWKDVSGAPAQTEWSPFKSDTTYFQPSEKPFMFNYRVADLVGLMAALKEEGVQIVGEIQDTEYGKFGWIIDPEGNKIELWEPKEA